MLIDMHTHTCHYSPCSSWTPAGMVEAAMESGLHGMVITEHDTLWSKAITGVLRDLNVRKARQKSIAVLSGNEFKPAFTLSVFPLGINHVIAFIPQGYHLWNQLRGLVIVITSSFVSYSARLLSSHGI